MTFHQPGQTEPHDLPLQFQALDGEWHLFGKRFFAENSEHVMLTAVYAYNSTQSGEFTDQIFSGWLGFG